MGGTVLIAEDEEINYLYVIELLSNAGIKYLLAKNGKEAIELCANHPEIKLVVMDIKMPIINGYEATRKIKNILPDLPIIALTAHALSGDEKKAREAGCDDYLSKPVKRDVFLNMISRYLEVTK